MKIVGGKRSPRQPRLFQCMFTYLTTLMKAAKETTYLVTVLLVFSYFASMPSHHCCSCSLWPNMGKLMQEGWFKL